MKNNQTFRRFNGMAFLAGAGCLAVLLFEAFFIFELYDNLSGLTERIPFFRGDPSPPPVKERPSQSVPPLLRSKKRLCR